MVKFSIARKTNRMKFLTKAAQEFLCSRLKMIHAIVEDQIIWNENQEKYWDKDGQNIRGNIFIESIYESIMFTLF